MAILIFTMGFLIAACGLAFILDNGFDSDSIYRIGCDVAAGFDLAESIQVEQES